MKLNEDKIDEAVLALLQLGLHDHFRVWKSFDWNAMDRLCDKGYITDPACRAKSVVLTELGMSESQRLLVKLFGQAEDK